MTNASPDSTVGRLPSLAARAATTLAAVALLAATSACGEGAPRARAHGDARVHPGGELVAAVRDDPPTFNPYAGRGTSVSEAVTRLVHAPLVRLNRATGEVEPWLAERWTESADGRTWTLALREGVRFSDGARFTSADVLFALAAVYEPSTLSAIDDSLRVDGERVTASAPDDLTVVLQFAARPGSGLQILDNLPILPRHKLQKALDGGRLGSEWTLSAAPADVVGLGPFRLSAYRPSEAIVLERNPHYWRRDGEGRALPYLDRLTLAIVRDTNTEVLRLQHGQIDIGAREVRPEDYAALRADAERGQVQLADAGTSVDANMLWFDLRPGAYAGDPRKPWLQSREFRQAISYAVDRQALVNQVYLGAAVPVSGPVTPGNRRWFSPTAPQYPYDPGRARALLEGLGLTDRTGDGFLEDRHGRPVRFSILSQQQDTIRMRSVAVVQEHLRRAGIVVDLVGLDPAALVERWATGRYDAIYFGVEASSYDPADNLDFWLSSGSFHLWHAGQETPGTGWERRIDELMTRLAVTKDPDTRRQLFDQAQRIASEELPVICFAAPRLVVAMSPRVLNATPAPLKPAVLWNADTLAVQR